MVGGLIVSQALTLFTTPVIYLYLDKLSNAFAGWGRSGKVEDDDRNEDEHASVKEAAE
jgi:HAE1 family hydrophobic/amphiphilic exporter-1